MYEKEKKALEKYAEINGSTSEQGIEQPNGSVVVLRSVQGANCEMFTLSAKEREGKGWPPPR
jgi:hypothetical protein